MTRPVAFVITSAMTRPTSRSDGRKPGTSALVESASSRSTPSSPSREKPGRSVSRPSSGVWSILKSPVCSTDGGRPRIATASASGIEWLTAIELQTPWPDGRRLALADLAAAAVGSGVDQVSRTPARACSRDPMIGMSATLAQQVGQRADVVLMSVSEHDRRRCRPGGRGKYDQSGNVRSTPGELVLPRSMPQSTTSRRLPPESRRCSNTVMLRPISEIPPSATTRKTASANAGGLHAGPRRPPPSCDGA